MKSSTVFVVPCLKFNRGRLILNIKSVCCDRNVNFEKDTYFYFFDKDKNMTTARCSICRKRYINLQKLHQHYILNHSKTNIAKQLIKLRIALSTPTIKPKKLKNRKIKMKKRLTKNKTETVYFSDTVNITVGYSDITVEDVKNDSMLKFPINVVDEPKITKDRRRRIGAFGKKRRKKNVKKDSFHINISTITSRQSLDEQIGHFYACCCKKDPKFERNSNLIIITTDTNDCSDNPESPEVQISCLTCGNGYRTDFELAEHCRTLEHLPLQILPNLKIYACHLCNAQFLLYSMAFKHLEWHVEDRILEDVVDMENSYYCYRNAFVVPSYPVFD